MKRKSLIRKSLFILIIMLLLSFASCAQHDKNKPHEDVKTGNEQKNICLPHEHKYTKLAYDSEYHWKECSYPNCDSISEKQKHYPGLLNKHKYKNLIEGNVDTRSYFADVLCDGCGQTYNEVATNTYFLHTNIFNLFRFRIKEVDTDTVIVNSQIWRYLPGYPMDPYEFSKQYALLKIEVLETYIQYNNGNASSDIMIDKGSCYGELFSREDKYLIVPSHLLEYYTRYDEYITEYTDNKLSLYYNEGVAKVWADSCGYDNPKEFEKYKGEYDSDYFLANNILLPYRYDISNMGSPMFSFSSCNTMPVIPILDGKIDFSRYTEEEKKLFYNAENMCTAYARNNGDTIIRYLVHYVSDKFSFSFDYTLEEFRQWYSTYTTYLLESQKKFIQEDGEIYNYFNSAGGCTNSPY